MRLLQTDLSILQKFKFEHARWEWFLFNDRKASAATRSAPSARW
jgi:hypothetical protein